MIKGKDKKWHYDMCIEMWNCIAEYDCEKEDTPHVQKYDPESNCFACEYHDTCVECPFFKFKSLTYGDPCMHDNSPYLEWTLGIGEKGKAIEIAQLFIDSFIDTDYYSLDHVISLNLGDKK